MVSMASLTIFVPYMVSGDRACVKGHLHDGAADWVTRALLDRLCHDLTADGVSWGLLGSGGFSHDLEADGVAGALLGLGFGHFD